MKLIQHHIRRHLAGWLLMATAALLLAACGGQTTPTATVAVATPAARLTDTPTATAAPSDTPTTVPSDTPTTAPSHTPTATMAPSDTPTSAPSNTPQAGAAFDPAAVTIALEPVVQGLSQPLFVTHAGDGSGRLFVIEKAGTIRIWSNGQLLPTPFLDIRARVGSSGFEQGLLGLAFAPQYRETGYFFVDYTDLRGNTVVSRFQVSGDANVANPDSEFKILGIDQPAANHNGGMLLFGPDGMLWIGTGDGGASGDRFGNGQNPQTLLGKMLRLDVTSDPSRPYSVPQDNPWVTATWNGQSVRPEIWAVGLRNPWRYSFDKLTGDLWIGDVGQNIYEEVDFVPAEQKGYPGGGLNFGWPIMEGKHCYNADSCSQAGLEMPVLEYNHNVGGCSITGGYVYRGTQFPILDGVYFYGDYCSGFTWAADRQADGTWRSTRVLQSGLGISSFGEDEQGELYVTDINGGGVYRLVVR